MVPQEPPAKTNSGQPEPADVRKISEFSVVIPGNILPDSIKEDE